MAFLLLGCMGERNNGHSVDDIQDLPELVVTETPSAPEQEFESTRHITRRKPEIGICWIQIWISDSIGKTVQHRREPSSHYILCQTVSSVALDAVGFQLGFVGLEGHKIPSAIYTTG